ncbi:hypothetical protein ACHAXN_010507 [Cyclotella atomus]
MVGLGVTGERLGGSVLHSSTYSQLPFIPGAKVHVATEHYILVSWSIGNVDFIRADIPIKEEYLSLARSRGRCNW